MSFTTSPATMEGEDIFDREKIKIMSYDMYSRLVRYRFVRACGDEYYYIDGYTDKVLNFPYRLKTLSDYSDYLILVY